MNMPNLPTKIKNAPPEVFKDRFLLLSIILLLWGLVKFLEFILPDRFIDFLPGPLPLAFLFVLVAIMFTYMIVIYIAQKWTQRKSERAKNEVNEAVAKEMLENYNYPSVDVFVAAHNERSVILNSIKNFLEIDYPNYKLYIIDDRSIDKTAELVSEFIEKNNLQDKVILIERKSGDKPGKAASLNTALSQSNGELILVFDADATVERDCLKKSILYFLDLKVGAVQFQKKITNANFNILTFCQDLEFAFDTYLQLGRNALKGFVELRGNGQLISRKCLENIVGWDERSLTEDLEMSVRISASGQKIRFAPEIIVQEEGVVSPKALLRQRKRWAEGSLRRYLTHWNLFVGPKSKITFIQRLDILPFLCQFAVPAWIFLDIILEIINFLNGQKTHITVLMLASFLFGLNMCINVCIAVRRWRNYSTFDSIRYGILAFSYGASYWPGIVLWTMRKVLFSRRSGEWSKTPRMLDLINN